MPINNQSSFTSKYALPDGTEEVFSLSSNTVSTANIPVELTKTRSVSKEWAVPGEDITQTLILANTSAYEISNINFTDTITGPATFKAGSVTIDGTPYSSFDPTAGFTLPNNLAATTGTATITYEMTINNPASINAQNAPAPTVTTNGALTYTAEGQSFTDTAGSTSVSVLENRLTIVKSVDKVVAKAGDELTYTSVITNTGSLKNTSIVFTDPIPTGTTFVTGSVTIDGTSQASYNPATGFSLADLNPDASTTVVFKVTVN